MGWDGIRHDHIIPGMGPLKIMAVLETWNDYIQLSQFGAVMVSTYHNSCRHVCSHNTNTNVTRTHVHTHLYSAVAIEWTVHTTTIII